MKTDSFPSLTDYFNYYLAGFCWLACGFLILIPQVNIALLSLNQTVFANGLVLMLSGILLVIVPYIVGFVLTPFAEAVTRCLRWAFGDPKKIMIYDNGSLKKWNARIWKRRLSESVIDKTIAQANVLFSASLKKGPSKLDNWYEVFFSYIVEYGNGLKLKVIRTRDLINFTESILIPVPLFFFLLAPWQPFMSDWQMRIIGIAIFILLSWRYLLLRKFLTMQIYRAILVLTAKKNSVQ